MSGTMHRLENAKVGKRIISKDVYIDKNVVVGDNKIQNSALIYDGVKLRIMFCGLESFY